MHLDLFCRNHSPCFGAAYNVSGAITEAAKMDEQTAQESIEQRDKGAWTVLWRGNPLHTDYGENRMESSVC